MKRSTVILINVLALLMLVAVLTGHLFQVPALDETMQTTLIVLALSLSAASTFITGRQKQANLQ